MRLLSHDKPVIPGSHLLHTHQVCRADVTSHISSTASSFLQFLSLLSLSYFPPSPLHITLSPRALTLYLSHSSHPPPLSLASFPSDFFFFYCSTLHTPSCCSKSLKGTELVGVVAVVMEALALPAWLWVGLTYREAAQTLSMQTSPRTASDQLQICRTWFSGVQRRDQKGLCNATK